MLGDPQESYHGPAEAHDLQEYTDALHSISGMVAAANAMVNSSVEISAVFSSRASSSATLAIGDFFLSPKMIAVAV